MTTLTLLKSLPIRLAPRQITLAVALLSAAVTSPLRSAEGPSTSADQIARGQYLVTIAVCNDCHTPWTEGSRGPEPDKTRLLSGHPQNLKMPAAPSLPSGPWQVTVAGTNTAWAGPWGVSFTANLTPDPETGLGRWTPRNFKDTIRSGRHKGRGRLILPPMPIPMYKQLTDPDLEAIFAYLQSIPPISNRVPEPLPPREIETAANP